MPAPFKFVLVIALAAVLITSIAVGATVGTIYRAGTVSVSVTQNGGGGVDVAVPAGLAQAAFWAVSMAPTQPLELDRETRQALRSLESVWPATQDALNALAAQPDFVLFEMNGPSETVRIEKRGRKLWIYVDESDQTIEVSLPLSTVRAFSKRLERISDRLSAE